MYCTILTDPFFFFIHFPALPVFLSWKWIESPKKKGNQTKPTSGQYSTPQQHTPSFPGTLPISSPFTPQQTGGFNSATNSVQPSNSQASGAGLPPTFLPPMIRGPSAPLLGSLGPTPPQGFGTSGSAGGSGGQFPMGTGAGIGSHIDTSSSHTQSSIAPPALGKNHSSQPSMPNSNRATSSSHPPPVRKSSVPSQPPFLNAPHGNSAHQSSHFKNSKSTHLLCFFTC